MEERRTGPEPSEELRQILDLIAQWRNMEEQLMRRENAELLGTLSVALASGEHRANPNWVRTEHSLPIAEQLPPVSIILNTRIEELLEQVAALFLTRRGTRDAEGTYWCVCCGRNTVDPEAGQDTCWSCVRCM